MVDVPTSHAWRALQPVYRQAWLGSAIALAAVALAVALIVVRIATRSTSNGQDTVLARITSPTGDRHDFSVGQRFRTAWVLGFVSTFLLLVYLESVITLHEGEMVSPVLALPPLVTLSAALWAIGMRVMRTQTAFSDLPLAALVGALTGTLISLNLRRVGIPAGFVAFCGVAGAGAVLGVLSEVRLRMTRPVEASQIEAADVLPPAPLVSHARLRIR